MFSSCKWFTREWNLQGLIIPKSLIFFSRGWTWLGTKDELATHVVAITGIQTDVLRGRESFLDKSVAAHFSWTVRRRTTRKEDIAYCLLGLFDVNMPLLYSEGGKAFLRLQEQIQRLSDDHSLFAWQQSYDHTSEKGGLYSTLGMLASHPLQFAYSGDVVATPHSYGPYSLTNQGLHIQLPILRDPFHEQNCTAILSCRFENDFPLELKRPM
jgi:hypothetical protein